MVGITWQKRCMRKRYTAAERRRFLEALQESGEPVKEVARRLGIGASTAYLWQQRANGSSPPSKPVPKAKPTFAQVVPASRPAVLVQVGGATMRVEAGFDAALLGEVVAALDRRNR